MCGTDGAWRHEPYALKTKKAPVHAGAFALNKKKSPTPKRRGGGGNFDLEHYKSIHKFLFEDLYSWAGELRKINISKKGTNFANADELEYLCTECFQRLKENNYYRNTDFDSFVENIVDLYCTLNILHPLEKVMAEQKEFLFHN